MDKPCKSVSPAKESQGILEGKRQGWRQGNEEQGGMGRRIGKEH